MGPGSFRRGKKYILNLSALEARRCAGVGSCCPPGAGAERDGCPSGVASGSAGRDIPRGDAGWASLGKGQGENGASAEPARPWPGQDPHLWYFLLCYAGKGSLWWVLCQETFCEGAEAAACREAACGAARRLPAREVVACISSSALLFAPM